MYRIYVRANWYKLIHYDECAHAYASSNKTIFSLWRNYSGDNDVDFIDGGRLFQQVEPETVNDREPY